MSQVFEVGDRVVAHCHYMWSLTPGKVYTVTEFTPELVGPTFTWPAYVTVIGDLGRPVTAHWYRFKPEEVRQ